MAPKVFALLVAFALLAAACGEVGQPTSRPTPDVPIMTEEAVVGLVSSGCRKPGLAGLIRSEAQAVYEGKGVWAVECDSGGWSGQWEVYEVSGVVAPVGRGSLHVACQTEPSQ
jgi:hypothetical protein